MAARFDVRFASRLPKSGNSPEECEDDFHSAQTHFAVADGASEGSYSQIWAGILVRSFCATADVSTWHTNGFASWLDECRLKWSTWEQTLAEKELPWFTQEKLHHGAFATFLGFSIGDDRWHAFACGDSCLFVVRDDALVEAFPVGESRLFDNTPALVPSTRRVPVESLQVHTGEILGGDRIYLTSDALAHWFLSNCEAKEQPWVALDGIQSEQEFANFVAEKRQSQAMRNDDVTLLSLRFAD